MKQNGKKRKMTKKRRQKRKLIRLALLLILMVILLIAFFGVNKWSMLDRISIGKGDIKLNEFSEQTKKSMKGYRTIAVFGLDNRSNGNFESGNSDTIIIVSINNKTNEIKMASVYRDTYLDIGDGKFNKANSAYNRGGPKQAINMLNKNLDLHITDYVSVDFNAVVDAVDAVGGIELDITAEEAKYINGYIDETSKVTGKTSNHISAGLQTVDGIQATAYARIRYTEGWDYKRTERQRVVIMKVFEKAKQANLATLNEILNTMLPEVSTSLSLTEMLGMAKDVSNYTMGENTGFPFDKVSTNAGSVSSAVVAVGFADNVAQLHNFLFENETYTPSATVEEIGATIRNQTGY